MANKKFKRLDWLLIIFLVAIVILAGLFVARKYFLSAGVTQLPGSEISQYQGQKLSPLKDLQNVSYNGTPTIDQTKYQLEISGLVNQTKDYSYQQVLDFPHYSKVVQLNCVEGWSAKILWEGVLLKDLLISAGIKPNAKMVIFYAADGFTTSLPLDYVINNNIILASKINGVVLPTDKGWPFQVVAEQKWGYKWIKWVTKIELSDNVNYRGTYESAGYNNNGDLNGPKTETK